MTPRAITMDDGVSVARQAAADIEAWLRGLEQTVSVQNVEGDAKFQRVDVDLIWTTQKGRYRIEIKGDRWQHTGNFFFETHSNREKGTPGCFVYTEADLLFYYFVGSHVLYILPMPATRAWFLANHDRFEERATTTPAGDGHYTTVGRLVPIADVLREVKGVRKVEIP
jgi:hypothetical protein